MMKIGTSKLGEKIIIITGKDGQPTECEIEDSQRFGILQRFFVYQQHQHDLIENQDQIDARLSQDNFSRCLFLINADFSSVAFPSNSSFKNATFTKSASFIRKSFSGSDFSDATFLGRADFREVNFQHGADFRNAEFTKIAFFIKANFSGGADFSDATFLGRACFSDALFEQTIHFSRVTFEKEVRFCQKKEKETSENSFDYPAKFKGNVWFDKSQFKGDAHFNMVSFGADAGFRDCQWHKKIDFQMANVKDKFIFANVKNKGEMKLDLKSFNFSYIDYTDSEININQSENRETFQILKHSAIQQNDQVKALEFHVKEMEKHRNSVGRKKFDWWLLFFEKFASYYGTKPWLPLFWIFVLQGFMVFLIAYSGTHNDMKILDYLAKGLNYKFWSHDFLANLQSTKCCSRYALDCLSIGWLKVINSIKNIFIAVLLYELIKSFRKFSRKF